MGCHAIRSSCHFFPFVVAVTSLVLSPTDRIAPRLAGCLLQHLRLLMFTKGRGLTITSAHLLVRAPVDGPGCFSTDTTRRTSFPGECHRMCPRNARGWCFVGCVCVLKTRENAKKPGHIFSGAACLHFRFFLWRLRQQYIPQNPRTK